MEASTACYVIRCLAFSPDSTKLAVAQSDNCVFVYRCASLVFWETCALFRLGMEWGEKKAICNKFHCPVSIMSLQWPIASSEALVYGGLDGSIRLGTTQTNSSQQIFSHPQSSPIQSLHSKQFDSHILASDVHSSLSSENLSVECRLYSWMDRCGRRVQRTNHSLFNRSQITAVFQLLLLADGAC